MGKQDHVDELEMSQNSEIMKPECVGRIGRSHLYRIDCKSVPSLDIHNEMIYNLLTERAE